MTTITIKDGKKLFTKTNFETVENLFDYLLQHLYFDKNLPELTAEELSEAEQAKKEWKKNPVKFSKALKEDDGI